MKKLKEVWSTLAKEKGSKKAIGIVTVICLVFVGVVSISIYGYTHSPQTETKSENYLQYVDGLKNWEVEIGDSVDFMKGVTWDEEEIASVKVNDSKVDLEKEGTYSIVYTIDVKKNGVDDLKSKKSVKVLKSEEEKESKDDQNKTEEQVEPETEKKNNTVQEETKEPNVSSQQNVVSTQNKTNGSTSKTESKPTHQHNWVAQTKTVHHDAVTEQQWVVDVPYQQIEHTVCNQCGAVLTSETLIAHDKAHVLAGGNGGWHSEWEFVQEQGHYETVEIQPAWDEQVVIGYKCSTCGSTK